MFKDLFRSRSADASGNPGESWISRTFERIAWAWDPAPFDGELLTRFGEQLLAIELADRLVSGPLPADADVDGYAHAWVALLADFHRLAPALQPSASELAAPRRLLAAYFLKVGDFTAAVDGLLSTVDERFNGGQFSQAAALLQMFDTDPATRHNNERNLFYEMMLTAYMGKRAKGSLRRDAWADAMSGLPASPADALAALVRHFHDAAGVSFHALHRPDLTTEPWSRVGSALSSSQQRDFEKQLAIPTMRPLYTLKSGEEVAARVSDHLRLASVSDYVERVTLSAYFHTLATGRTGFEHFILNYHSWLDSHFSVVSTRVLPAVHRASLDESSLLSSAARTQVNMLLAHKSAELREPSPDMTEDITPRIVAGLRGLDPLELPEGVYNLGGLLMDEALGFNAVPFVQRVRMHRLL